MFSKASASETRPSSRRPSRSSSRTRRNRPSPVEVARIPVTMPCSSPSPRIEHQVAIGPQAFPAGPAGRAALAPPEPAARENRGRALPRRGDVAARRLQRGGVPRLPLPGRRPPPRHVLEGGPADPRAAAARAQRGAAGAVQGPGRVLGRRGTPRRGAGRGVPRPRGRLRVRRRPAVPPAVARHDGLQGVMCTLSCSDANHRVVMVLGLAGEKERERVAY